MSDIRKYIELLESSYNDLDEGTIKLPPKHFNESIKELLKVVCTTVIRNSQRKPTKLSIYDDYGVDFKDYGADYDVIENDQHSHIQQFDTNDIPINIKYHGTVSVGILYNNDKNVESGEKGTYNKIGDIAFLIVSLYDTIKAYIDMVNSDESLLDMKKKVVPLIQSNIGTLEHELSHAIQYDIIKHPVQVKKNVNYSKNYDDYVSSYIEYKPQITSAINNMLGFVDGYDIENEIEVMKLFLYMVASKPLSSIDYDVGDVTILNDSRGFFSVLKNKKPKAYKDAVKVLYNELKKLYII